MLAALVVLLLALPASAADDALAVQPLKGRLVVLDAGHGGVETGAYRQGIKEKDITLQITLRVKKMLEAQGATVRLTRADDSFVSLQRRVDISNAVKPDVFVSIHINCTGQRKTSLTGVEVWYRTKQSRRLAFTVDAALATTLSVANRGVKSDDLYVVHHTDAPSVLVESGFINNPVELQKLLSASYQDKIASAITSGLDDYFSGARVQPVMPRHHHRRLPL